MNQVTLIGRLCADVERKELPSGSIKADFRLAVERRKKEDGADFLNIVAWGKTVDFLTQYTAKGDKIAVVGRIATRDYTDKDGIKRTITEIIADTIELVQTRRKDEPPQVKPADLTPVEDADLPFI